MGHLSGYPFTEEVELLGHAAFSLTSIIRSSNSSADACRAFAVGPNLSSISGVAAFFAAAYCAS
jgi:hypothetical protein